MLSEKIVESLVNQLHEDISTIDARAYRETLLGLVRAAKAEQRVVLAERRAAQPQYHENVFSIESLR